jgi:hypothetical protein
VDVTKSPRDTEINLKIVWDHYPSTLKSSRRVAEKLEIIVSKQINTSRGVFINMYILVGGKHSSIVMKLNAPDDFGCKPVDAPLEFLFSHSLIKTLY